MNDAEAYHKLYGRMIFFVPFYQNNFSLVDICKEAFPLEVVR